MKNAAAPTVVSRTAQARVVLDKLRALRDDIPGFTQAATNRRDLFSVASVPNAFIEAASIAVESSPDLESAAKFDTADARDVVAFSTAYEAVAEEAEAFARAIRHTITVRRAATGASALQIYELAKAFARKSEGAALRSHIEQMKQTLGRTKGGRRHVAPPEPVKQ